MVDCSGCAGCDDYSFCKRELRELEKQDSIKHENLEVVGDDKKTQK